MKLKNLLIVLGTALVLLVVSLWIAGSNGESAVEEVPPQEKTSRRIGEAKKRVKNKRTRDDKVSRTNRKSRQKGAANTRRKGLRPVTDNYSPEDRKLADAVQAALDDEDFEKMRIAAAAAMKSQNSDVRSEAVDGLGWFEAKALVDLTKAMRDKDPDVADSARSHVENALMGLDDNAYAFALAAEYMKQFADKEDARTMFSGIFNSAAAQIIDPDDSDSAEDVAKAKSNRADIVGVVAEMVEMGGKIASEAKEIYESVSGEEWTDRAAADNWANDIEEPESED